MKRILLALAIMPALSLYIYWPCIAPKVGAGYTKRYNRLAHTYLNHLDHVLHERATLADSTVKVESRSNRSGLHRHGQVAWVLRGFCKLTCLL